MMESLRAYATVGVFALGLLAASPADAVSIHNISNEHRYTNNSSGGCRIGDGTFLSRGYRIHVTQKDVTRTNGQQASILDLIVEKVLASGIVHSATDKKAIRSQFLFDNPQFMDKPVQAGSSYGLHTVEYKTHGIFCNI